MPEMTHRERVLAALSHRQPDRVPIDLGATRNSSIVVEGYQRLAAHFGVPAEAPLASRMMRVVEVDERILQALDVDVRSVFPATSPDVMLARIATATSGASSACGRLGRTTTTS